MTSRASRRTSSSVSSSRPVLALARYQNAVVEPDKDIRDTIYPNFGLGADMDGSQTDFSDADLSDVDFSNIDFGDLKLGDDFNPDDFIDDQGGNDFGADSGNDLVVSPRCA